MCTLYLSKDHRHIHVNDMLRGSGSVHVAKNTTEDYAQARRGGGGTLIFSYICRLEAFFLFKILNSNIFVGFQKK